MSADLTLVMVILPVVAILSGWYVYAGVFGGMCGDATAARARRSPPGAFLLFLAFTGIMAGAWNNILFLLASPFSMRSLVSQNVGLEAADRQQFLFIILPRAIDLIWFVVAIALVYGQRHALREWLADWGCKPHGWRWLVLLGVPISLLQGLFSLGNLLAQTLIQLVSWDISTSQMTIVVWQVAINLLVAGVIMAVYTWLFRGKTDAISHEEI